MLLNNNWILKLPQVIQVLLIDIDRTKTLLRWPELTCPSFILALPCCLGAIEVCRLDEWRLFALRLSDGHIESCIGGWLLHQAKLPAICDDSLFLVVDSCFEVLST